LPHIWFFAGGTFANGRTNAFTATFIGEAANQYGDRFRVVEGIYHKWSFFNVLWALTWAQRPFRHPERRKYMQKAIKQISFDGETLDSSNLSTHAIMIASSYGSVVAAQFGVFLGQMIRNKKTGLKTFDLLLGTTVLSPESDLFKQLVQLRSEGIIRKLLYHEMQDEGDNAAGLAGRNRLTAYLKALGIVFPWLTIRYSGPSFLNQHPQKGHIHQRRAHSTEKAMDFLRVLENMR